MFLSDRTPLLAIDIGTHSIKLAQLASVKGGYELLSFGILPLQYESIVGGVVKNMTDVVETLEKLVKAENIKTKFTVSSIAGEAVIVKRIKMQAMTREELAENIRVEAEQYIPFDIDKVSMDFQIIRSPGEQTFVPEKPEDKDQMEVLLAAVQTEAIDSRMEALETAGLKPVIIDLDVFAAMNAAGLSEDLELFGAIALVDLGFAFTNINILSHGVTHFIRDFHVGGRACTEKLMADFDVSFKEASDLKRGRIPDKIDKDAVVKIIVESFDPILEELQNSFEGFKDTNGIPVEKVLLCGGDALINGVDHLFMARLDLSVEILNPLKTLKINPKKFDLDCITEMAPIATVALGLATRRFDYK